jgi:hypothetical protein
MYLLAICTSSFENSLFNLCVHFFIVLLSLWGLSFLSSWILVPIRWIPGKDFLPFHRLSL